VARLSAAERSLLLESRFAVMATIRPDGRPRLVPCAFAVVDWNGTVVYSALDDKRKRVPDPLALARVRDIRARPHVSLLVHRWAEDWARLAWLRLDGAASVMEPPSAEHESAVRLLHDRYPQYASHRLEERPLIRIAVEAATSWSAAG
jgi:PPOX class probable F420-dependent enzyme